MHLGQDAGQLFVTGHREDELEACALMLHANPIAMTTAMVTAQCRALPRSRMVKTIARPNVLLPPFVSSDNVVIASVPMKFSTATLMATMIRPIEKLPPQPADHDHVQTAREEASSSDSRRQRHLCANRGDGRHLPFTTSLAIRSKTVWVLPVPGEPSLICVVKVPVRGNLPL
jgi:hypothetical protein